MDRDKAMRWLEDAMLTPGFALSAAVDNGQKVCTIHYQGRSYQAASLLEAIRTVNETPAVPLW